MILHQFKHTKNNDQLLMKAFAYLVGGVLQHQYVVANNAFAEITDVDIGYPLWTYVISKDYLCIASEFISLVYKVKYGKYRQGSPADNANMDKVTRYCRKKYHLSDRVYYTEDVHHLPTAHLPSPRQMKTVAIDTLKLYASMYFSRYPQQRQTLVNDLKRLGYHIQPNQPIINTINK